MSRVLFAFMAVLAMGFGVARAAQVEDLRAEVEKLRNEISKHEAAPAAPIGRAESLCDNRYGPNEKVTTKSGKLTVGALVQVWYQNIQQDRHGLVYPGGQNNLPFPEPNELNDNSTFRVRRTELRLNLDATENVNAFVLLDPSREGNVTFTPVPTFPLHNAILTNARIQSGAGQQAGNSIIPQLLQDAYINVHGIIPHHDFTMGQFKPPSGEEAWRNSGQLEFVERAMVTSINNVRDIGVMVHGSWIDSRVQYWVGAFNGPDGSVLTDPEIVEGGNRSDTNDAKDIAERIAVNPVWSTEKWYGRLQVGGARTDGLHGESGSNFDFFHSTNGLNREKTWINRNAAWVWYRPNGIAKGLWVRGEYGSQHDRYDPRFRTNLLNLGSGSGFPIVYPNAVVDPNGKLISGGAFRSAGQAAPTAVTVTGYSAAIGYKLSDSIFAESIKNGCAGFKELNNLEFALRFETYQNVAAESLTNPDRQTDLLETKVFTSGINYYIKGHDAKVQVNYDIVMDPNNANRGIHSYKNNVLVVAFQLMF